MKFLSLPRALTLVCFIGTLSFVGGCSANMNMPDTQGTSDFGNVHGGVYGGQQPITAAHVYVFEAPITGNPGYGNTLPKSLIGNVVNSTYDKTGTCTSAVKLPLVYDGSNCYYQTGGANYAAAAKINPLVSDAGGFNLTGFYKCDVGANVWLYSISGYPVNSGTTGDGNGGNTTTSRNDLNPYATLMADLGQCPASGNFSADSYIYVNELSTVAMAYAVAGFSSDTSGANSGLNTEISAPLTNTTGFINAFNTAQQLYNIFGLTDQGDLSAPQTTTVGLRNGVPPYYLINTVGDALASCINSAGNSATAGTPSSNCNTLFIDAYNVATNPPITDTASAAIYLAQHPANGNTANLLSLANINPVWLPNFASGGAPSFNDFTAAISYSGGGTPQGISLDPGGNVFTDNYSATGFMDKLSPLGVVTTTSALTNSVVNGGSLAVDSTGLIWTPSYSSGAIYKVSNTAAFTSVTTAEPTGTLNATNNYVDPIAADGSGYVYIADYNVNAGEIYKVNNAGTVLTITSSTVPGGYGCVTQATGVAIDSVGYLWVTGTGTDTVCRITNTGSSVSVTAPRATGHGVTGTPIPEADAVAVDSANSAWVLNESGNGIYKVAIPSSGIPGVVTGPFTGGGMTGPLGITIDGNGNVWTINYSGSGTGSISEFNHAGTPLSPQTYGYQYGNLIQPQGLAIDISGNLWIANFGASSVMEVVGVATPTAALITQKPGTTP